MKEQVENLLKKGKEKVIAAQERKIASDKRKRDNHLISIGLIDEEKINRIYSDNEFFQSKFDEKKGKYYKEEVVALEVTDDEYEEICRYFPPKTEKTEKTETTVVSGTTNKRYPALRTTVGFFSVLAGIIGVAAVIFAVISFAQEMGMLAIPIIVGGAIIVLGLFATAELIKVIIDIEENTRKGVG